MRAFASAFLALGLTLILHGCGGDDEPTPAPSPAPSPTDEAPNVTVDIVTADGAMLISADAKATRVGMKDGYVFTEGPVYFPPQEKWFWSDVVGNAIWDFTPASGAVQDTFLNPSNKSNGLVIDNDNNLVICEHQGRRISIVNPRGAEPPRTLVDSFNGSLLTSPNDITITSKGMIYFTDPSYGTDPGFGHGMPKEQEYNNVFMFNPATKDLESVAQDFGQPNGLAFNAEETKLYIADSGVADGPNHIREFSVNADGTLSGGGIFVTVSEGAPDGLKVDSLGNIWSTSKLGIQAYKPDGTQILQIHVEATANFAFGGSDGMTLLMTSGKNVYTIPVKVTGAPRTGPPMREMQV